MVLKSDNISSVFIITEMSEENSNAEPTWPFLLCQNGISVITTADYELEVLQCQNWLNRITFKYVRTELSVLQWIILSSYTSIAEHD